MINFKTKIEGYEDYFDFECYENTEPIELGEKYIFFFGGIADVQVCDSENIQEEINKHDRPYQHDKLDFTHNFWTECFKIKTTNFDLTTVS